MTTRAPHDDNSPAQGEAVEGRGTEGVESSGLNVPDHMPPAAEALNVTETHIGSAVNAGGRRA